MIIKTLVEKIGVASDYIGKPVNNIVGHQIGTITKVQETDNGQHFELIMEVVGLYTKPDSDEYNFKMKAGKI